MTTLPGGRILIGPIVISLMADLAIVSDTHIPTRANSIPEPFRDRIAAADHVIHAGDFTTQQVLNELRGLAGDSFTAVTGNMDPRDLELPSVATLDIADLRFVVTHGTGSPGGYDQRVIETTRSAEGDIGIAGHTHNVLDTTIEGIRLLNPGSLTGAPPADRTTMMTASIDGTALDVTIHEY